MTRLARQQKMIARSSKKVVAIRLGRMLQRGIEVTKVMGETGLLAGKSSEGSPEARELQTNLRSEGYAIIRDVLPAERVATLRRAVQEYMKSAGECRYGGKFKLYALYDVEDVAKTLTSLRVLDQIKQITHPLEVILTGECDLMINTTSSWHNDVPHHPASSDGSIFADETFRVYKIAFYLQDQDEASLGTLKVRPGSHLKGLVATKSQKAMAVRAGDAVIFDVRIEHAGQMPTMVDRAIQRFFTSVGPKLHLDVQKSFTSARSFLRRLSGTPDRVGIFMTFGPSEQWTYSYAEEGRNRHPGVCGNLSADVLSQLAQSQIAPPLIGRSSLH